MPLPGNQFLEAKYRWVPEHGYMLSIDANRLNELESDLAARGTCSQGVPKIPAAMRRHWMLCFICVKKGYFTHVARSVVYYPAESGKDRLDIWNLMPLSTPIRIAAIKAKVQGKQGWRAKRALDGGHISMAAFELIMEALPKANSEAAQIIEILIDRRPLPPEPTPTNAKINWAYQRDAVVTSLEIAGIPKEQLKARPQLDGSTAGDSTSIFDNEEDVRNIEDLAILRDLDGINDEWRELRRQRYPAKTFTNGDTKLTVILANKLPLERQLGIDLVYVNETLKSVVFVQYKMFGGTDGEHGYRPDKQLAKEMTRMEAAATKLAVIGEDDSCDGYRLGPDPFFLKFCSRLLSHDAIGHVPGLYVPVTYWKRLVKARTGKGERGGTVIYAENFGRRYFTPTLFIDMVNRGWIGTSTLHTEVLVPYLKAMTSGKAVVLAVQSLDTVNPDPIIDDAEGAPPRRVAPPKPRYPGRKPKIIEL